MNATRKVKLKEINPNLTCILCKGYFIDATTIIECLHSFCKSCIVKHLEKSEYCPACDVQLHTTKPLSSIRSDQMLQEIVYKLVPGLFQNETARRRQFYKENPESTPCSQEDSGHVYNYSYITSDDIIHLSLEYYTDDIEFRESTKRYIKCPAAVSIAILKKLIYGKFDLDNGAQIDVMYGDRILPDDFLLMDIAYKYSWTHNGNKPLQLCYQVKGIPKSSYLHLVKPKNSSATALEPKTTALAVKRRQSRTSTNAAATAITVNEKSTLDSTPNRKATQRGRRKRKVSDNEEIPGKIAKKTKKEPKVKPESSPLPVPEKSVPKVEPGSKSTATSTNPLPECKEVQLRISENGVISARSVSSGEEKIIINSVANNSTNVSTPSKMTLANTTPSTMISHLNNNVNKNHTPNITLHPILTNNSALPSPLDTALNRENCMASAIAHDKQNNTNSIGVTITNTIRDVNNSSPSAKFNLPPGTKLTPIRKKKDKPNQLEKPSERTTPAPVAPVAGVITLEKAKVSKKANQDKCANVKKAMSDLEKKLQTHTRKYTKKGATNLFPKDSPLGQSPMPIPTQTSQHHLQINGTLKHSVPSPLLHSLPPGTGLSLVPTTSASFNDPLNSPVKRFSQHNTLTTASVVNGDLKFTTSPKHLLPCPSPSKDPLVMGSPSPKKPPKFFKSRHSSSAAGSPVNGESPTSKSSTSKLLDSNSKSKINSLHVNGVSPKRTVDTITESINNAILNVCLPNTTNSTPTTSTAGFGSVGANSQFKFPPNLTNTLNAINMNLNMNNLNMSLAAANGVPINLVPFVTSNYCSMPFQSSRNPYNMNMSHLNLPFPFSYPGVSMSSAPATTASSSNSSPINITKQNNHHPVSTNPINPTTSTSSLSLPSSSSSPNSTSANNNHNNMNTLDLSMTKNKSHEGMNGKESHKFRPITSILPSSQSLNSQTPAVDRNHNNSEFLNIPRVGKSKPSPKALNPKPNPSVPRKSPIKNLEALLTLSGNGAGVGSSVSSAAGKVPEKSPTEKPVTNKSPGKKELADIIVNLTDQQKKLEKQANSNGTAANSSINNNSPKHVNNNNNVAIPTTIIPNNSSTSTATTTTGTKNHVVYLGLNFNGNTGSASGSNEKSNNNAHSSMKSIATSIATTLAANHSNVSLSACKTIGNDNHHHNNNNNKVIAPETNVGKDSSSCLKTNDSNSNNILANGPNGNVNSNGPLEGLNNLIANSTGSSSSGNSNTNNSTAPAPLPNSSSTSA